MYLSPVSIIAAMSAPRTQWGQLNEPQSLCIKSTVSWYFFAFSCYLWVVLTLCLILWCLLFEVLYEQRRVTAPGFTGLCQLVQDVHGPCVDLEVRHRLVSEHGAEPAVYLRGATWNPDDEQKPTAACELTHKVVQTNREHYLFDLFTHGERHGSRHHTNYLLKM